MKKKLEKFSQSDDCPIRNVLDRFGDKWSILIVLILGEEPRAFRFGELAGIIGEISQKMLTVTLKTLVADGLVARKQYVEIPPRVEYELTDLGRSLLPHLNALNGWALKNFDHIMKTRKKYAKRMEV